MNRFHDVVNTGRGRHAHSVVALTTCMELAFSCVRNCHYIVTQFGYRDGIRNFC